MSIKAPVNAKQQVIKTIAILTSGGDAPGMNAAIRACVTGGLANNYNVIGYKHGYNGLINQESVILDHEKVNNIIQLGGTILKSARCPAMLTEQGLNQAVNTLIKDNVDALIVIGGDGSFHGMLALSLKWHGQLIGIPGTIDNDVAGSDYTIGFATAIDTALSAIDKIRDTADAFDRIFIVELKGKHSGHIAFHVGLASSAEEVISFENFNQTDISLYLKILANKIIEHQSFQPGSFIICIAENLWPEGVQALVKTLKADFDIDATACILGHIQRGGSPVANDRILATKLGYAAIDVINQNKTNIMLGEICNQIIQTPISAAINSKKPLSESIYQAYLKSHHN
jgi:6-phosphofructokinase 1